MSSRHVCVCFFHRRIKKNLCFIQDSLDWVHRCCRGLLIRAQRQMHVIPGFSLIGVNRARLRNGGWHVLLCFSDHYGCRRELDGISLFSTQSLQPLKCNLDVQVVIFVPRPFAWLVHGCVTSEQRDPVPMMKRVRPHRTTTLLTCLNNSLWSVKPWLTGCGDEEDYTIALTGGRGDRRISKDTRWDEMRWESIT